MIRNAKGRRGPLAVASLLCLITGSAPLVCSEPDVSAADLPADLACIPDDAWAFVTLRGADLWECRPLKELRESQLPDTLAEALQAAEKELKETGFAIPEIERVNIVVVGPPAPGIVKILAMTRPCSRDQMLKLIGHPIRETLRGKVAFYTHPDGAGEAMCFADERTVLLGSAKTLQRCLEQAQQAHSGPPAEALKLAAEKRSVVGFGNIQLVRELAEQLLQQAEAKLDALAHDPGAFPGGEQVANRIRRLPPALRPLLPATCATMTVDRCDDGCADLRLIFANEAQTNQGEGAIKQLGTLLRDLIPRLRQSLAADMGKDFEDSWGGILLLFSKRVMDDPRGVSLKRDGRTLSVEVRLDPVLTTLIELRPRFAAKVSEAADRVKSSNNLKQIALAMHIYHDRKGRLPAAGIYDSAGKPLLSWRVAILPDIDEEALYKEFKLDQPWDSPHNKKLLARMPKVYAPVRGASLPPYSTYYHVFHGKGAAFEGKEGTRFDDFPDGLANTLLVVEAGDPAPWTQPKDLAYSPDGPLPRLNGPFKSIVLSAFADGSVRMIQNSMSESLWRALITRNGGEVIGPTDR
jgi:hypothetical protein